jgi:hypothetical protein
MQSLINFSIVLHTIDGIRDFLANRKQKVVINGTGSDWTTVTSGIPQGSVLFKIYINDLPDVVQNIAKLFADDIKIVCSSKQGRRTT